MESDISKKMDEQDKKLDAIYVSAEKMRKYFLWTLIITAAMIVIPLVGLVFVIPAFLKTMNLSGLGL
ncbi:MAG: hypothetical protein WA063_00375 [Minisyncoccia bacterium]